MSIELHEKNFQNVLPIFMCVVFYI